jgi:cell division septation protein DedD
MNDQSFHEIQLSGKQLLFGFMSAVVLLVVIFLLGVSVGRGARAGQLAETNPAAPPPTSPGDTTVSTTQPPVDPKPGELNYPGVLKGVPDSAGAQTPPAVPPPPQPETAKPAGDPQTGAAKPPAETQAGAAKSDPPPAPPQKPEERATTKTPPADGWFAQVGAYGTRRAADSIIADLKSKGFDARAYPFQGMFRVRVGPFATNAEAEQTRQRLLKAGHKSTVTR